MADLNLKYLPLIFLTVVAAGVGFEMLFKDDGASSATSIVEVEPKIITIDASQLSRAIYFGADRNGKSKAEYFLEFAEGTNIRLTSAYIYYRNISNSEYWQFFVGDNNPDIICMQSTREAKKVVAQLNVPLEDAIVTGTFDRTRRDRVILTNCTIEGGKQL